MRVGANFVFCSMPCLTVLRLYVLKDLRDLVLNVKFHDLIRFRSGSTVRSTLLYCFDYCGPSPARMFCGLR